MQGAYYYKIQVVPVASISYLTLTVFFSIASSTNAIPTFKVGKISLFKGLSRIGPEIPLAATDFPRVRYV